MPQLQLKPSHKVVKEYYDSLAKFERLGIKHEGAVRSAFHSLLESCARQFDWKLVPEYRLKGTTGKQVQMDGALLDSYGLVHGYWEAKDSGDDLKKEIKAKFAAGYPRDNILFQEPHRAVLFQQGRDVAVDIRQPEDLVHILTLFLEYAPPAIAQWEKAIGEFKDRVPQIGANIKQLIENERETNKKFIATFTDFLRLCRTSLNPNLSVEAVEEMLIQHLLTERIFRKIFDVGDFMQRNVIAQQIEKVISALTSKAFSRDDFVKSLDHFYVAIEGAADTIKDFSEKQKFLNTVYERFFQGFSVKVADTHGIVYTPQPIVQFMVNSVEHVLREQFGKSLSDPDVHILDPFTGTGNFIVNLMRHIKKSALPHKYREELHCNEVMLLPYYVASMNIEHAYFEATGQYEPFEGVCLVDTFETAETDQTHFEKILFNEANSARVKRQKKAEIRVVIANPPYNAGQVNENDNNKNRKYPAIDRRVRITYGADSEATLVRKLSDPYVKAIRYATDRIGNAGITCYVNNDSFVAEKTFDGMRKHLAQDFDLIYVLELGGNVRKNPKLSGTTHNVFGIQVGVSINLFVKLPAGGQAKRQAKLLYHAIPVPWRKEEKYHFLEDRGSVDGVQWRALKPDKKCNWLTSKNDEEFDAFLPLGTKDTKAGSPNPALFRTYSLGVSTNRDDVVYDFQKFRLADRLEQFVEDYNAELHRWKKRGQPPNLDDFLRTDHVKWSETLKRHLAAGVEAHFTEPNIRLSMYRPFCRMWLYHDPLLNDRPGAFADYFPTTGKVQSNPLLVVNLSPERPFCALCCNITPSKDVAGGFGSPSYCFPSSTFDADGKHMQDNVTLQALIRFQNFYADDAITRDDIFHYVYGLLHHPAYRARYAESLKRELPRIPLVAADGSLHAPPEPDKKSDPKASKKDAAVFHAFAEAGRYLANLHINYEQQPEFPLERLENKHVPLNWRVEAIKLTKDRSTILYNDFLTLRGIPPTIFDYKLGNRSALEWIIDQYRITRDDQGKIVSDPNRLDDEQYIVRLVGQVITVSLETLKTVESLPPLSFK